MKKLFAVLLALALVLSMGTIAFAEGENTGKITIYNTIKDETYTVYKMFDFAPVNGTATQGRYTVAAEWADFIKPADAENGIEAGEGAAYLKANSETGTIEWVGEETDVRKGALAKAAIAYAKEKGITGSSIVAASEKVEFANVALGYYAVDTSLGALCALTNTNNTAEVKEKNSGGSITKEVQEDDTNAWGATNDANIGQTVNFKSTITAGKGTVNYVMHDTMSGGLTFDDASVVVMNGEAKLSEGEDKDYVLKTACTDGCTFEIDFTDAYEATLNENDTIVVTYSAVLNEGAVIAGEGNPNTVYLTYGNAQKTNEEKTVTYTFQFQLVKTVADGTVLNGAKFKLYTAATGGKEIPVVKVSDNIYRVAKEGEAGVEIEAGYVTIRGLDSDTYYLEETKAPDGYNELTARQSVVIDGANNDAKVTDNKYENGGVQVINKTGTLLPETGGIGTTIFYIVGITLMLGAAIILITKKRMSTCA